MGSLGSGRQELGRVALARPHDVGLVGALLELVGVHRVAIEDDDLRRLLVLQAAHDMPLVHAQIGLAALLDDPGALGQVRDDLLGVAGVVHQQPEQLAVGGAVADVHGELGFGRGEAPGLDDLRHQVGAHLYGQLVAACAAPTGPATWLTPDTPSAISKRQQRQRLQQRPGRHAARRHDDELAVAVEPVEHVDGGDQQGDRRDQRHHARDGQRGHRQEAQGILALRGHQLELAQGHRDPDHARQGHEDEQERAGSLPKHVSAQDAHRVPPAPLAAPAHPGCAHSRLAIQGFVGFHSLVAERWPARLPNPYRL